MPSGKWKRKVDSEIPADRAARRVLAARLKTLGNALAEVVDAKCGDSETVHQLRVASRRATAAVESFEVCLPRRTALKLSNRVKAVRKAAGRIRDWDVFLEDLAERSKLAAAADAPGLDLLAGDCVARRIMAQAKFQKVCRQSRKPLCRSSTKLIEAISPSNCRSLTFADIGHSRLTVLTDRFFACTRNPLVEVADYHAIRLALKPLRYAVEIFSGCFAPELREQVYPQLEILQSLLGGIQDAQIATICVRELHLELGVETPPGWSRYDAPLRSLMDNLERTLVARCDKVQEWRAKQADELKADFQRVLSGSPP
jgi:CHAD domain-containing protein